MQAATSGGDGTLRTWVVTGSTLRPCHVVHAADTAIGAVCCSAYSCWYRLHCIMLRLDHVLSVQICWPHMCSTRGTQMSMHTAMGLE